MYANFLKYEKNLTEVLNVTLEMIEVCKVPYINYML